MLYEVITGNRIFRCETGAMNKLNKGLFGLSGKAKESLIQKALEQRNARAADDSDAEA